MGNCDGAGLPFLPTREVNGGVGAGAGFPASHSATGELDEGAGGSEQLRTHRRARGARTQRRRRRGQRRPSRIIIAQIKRSKQSFFTTLFPPLLPPTSRAPLDQAEHRAPHAAAMALGCHAPRAVVVALGHHAVALVRRAPHRTPAPVLRAGEPRAGL